VVNLQKLYDVNEQEAKEQVHEDECSKDEQDENENLLMDEE